MQFGGDNSSHSFLLQIGGFSFGKWYIHVEGSVLPTIISLGELLAKTWVCNF